MAMASPAASQSLVKSDANGGLHTHIDFSLRDVSDQLNGSQGAYRIELKLIESAANSEVSVSYAAKPVVIVFNQGLEEAEFEHAVEALEDSHEAAEYDDTTGILSIPEVEAFGKHYKIQLNNQGDFLFQLIEAHEVSDEDGHVHESGNFCLLANLLMNRGEVTGFRPLPLPNCWISGL